MIIKRRGYKTKGLTFAEFMEEHNLLVVVTGVYEGWRYFEATIEDLYGADYYVSKADGTKIKDLIGEGSTEAGAIKELAWQCQMQHIAQQGVCIKVPTLRIN